MARVWSESFGQQTTVAALAAWDTTTGSPTTSTSITNGGTASLNCATASSLTSYIRHTVAASTDVQDRYFRFYLRFESYPSAGNKRLLLIFGADQAYSMCSLRMNTDGTLELWNEDGGSGVRSPAQVGSSSSALSLGQWYRVELMVAGGNATKSIEAKIDGVTFASGVHTGQALNPTRMDLGIVTASIADLYIDDVAVNDASGSVNNSYPGEGYIVTMRPDGDGSSSVATRGGTDSGANWSQVSENTPNDLTDYLILANNNDTVWTTLESSLAAGIPAGSTIKSFVVGVRERAATAAAETWRPVFKVGSSGTVVNGTTTSHNDTVWRTNGDATPRVYKLAETTNPDTGLPLTTTDLDDVQIGVQAIDATPDVWVTTLWAMVEYEPATGSTASRLQTGVANIVAPIIVTDRAQTGVSKIVAVPTATTRTQAGISRISISALRTQTGVASLLAAPVGTTRNQTGLTRLSKSELKTQTGLAKIVAVPTATSRNQVGVARVSVSRQNTQTGITNLLAAPVETNRTQVGKAAISRTVARTQTGTANLLAYVNQAPTVTLNTSDGLSTSDTTPTLEFTGTDVESDDIQYQIQLDTSSAFAGTAQAPAFDSSSGGENADPFTGQTGFSFNHTISGTDRVLLVAASSDNGITSISYGGVALTKLSVTGGANNLWYVLDPPIGTASVAVTHPTTFFSQARSISITGVNQSNPFNITNGTVHNIGNSMTYTAEHPITTTAANTLIVAGVQQGIGYPMTPGPNQTNTASNSGGGSGSSFSESFTYKVAPTAGLNTLEETVTTFGSGEGISYTAIAFNPAGGGGTLIDTNSASVGFVNTVNGADTNPFTSGQKVSFTVQSDLPLDTYYYRVRGSDPTGSNLYGEWSETRSFIITELVPIQQTITGLARMAVIASIVQTGKSRIQALNSRTVTGLGRISISSARTITGTSRIRATALRTQTGIGRVQATALRTQLGKAAVRVTVSRPISGTATVVTTNLSPITGVARLQITSSRDTEGLARIHHIVPQGQDGTSRISLIGSNDQSGTSRIESSVTTEQTGKARLQRTELVETTGIARINKLFAQAILGRSRIAKNVLRTITGRGAVRKSVLRTLTGRSRLAKTLDHNIDGRSRITLAQSIPQTGTASILNTTNRQQSGIGSVLIGGQYVILGESRITNSATAEQTGKSYLTVIVGQIISGQANIGNVSKFTVTGRSRITTVNVEEQLGRAALLTTTIRVTTGTSRLEKADTALQTGTARITARIERPQQGVGRLATKADRLQTGRGDIKAITTRDQTGVSYTSGLSTRPILGTGDIATLETRQLRGQALVVQPLAPVEQTEGVYPGALDVVEEAITSIELSEGNLYDRGNTSTGNWTAEQEDDIGSWETP